MDEHSPLPQTLLPKAGLTSFYIFSSLNLIVLSTITPPKIYVSLPQPDCLTEVGTSRRLWPSWIRLRSSESDRLRAKSRCCLCHPGQRYQASCCLRFQLCTGGIKTNLTVWSKNQLGWRGWNTCTEPNDKQLFDFVLGQKGPEWRVPEDPKVSGRLGRLGRKGIKSRRNK